MIRNLLSVWSRPSRPPRKKRGRVARFMHAVSIIILIGITTILMLFHPYFFGNLAKREAKPFTKGLIEAGAIAKCEHSDPGHGPDNFSPWYSATYQTDISKTDAFGLVQRLAKENGFKLQQAAPGNNGGLPVADVYLDDWYFDRSSKMSSYNFLEKGPVVLAFELEDDETVKFGCGNENSVLRGDAHHTAIYVYIKLPRLSEAFH